MAEEAHREAMLRALAEADAAHQLMPELHRGESDRQIDLPLLPPELMERVSRTPMSRAEPAPAIRLGDGHTEPPLDRDQDVTMTQ
jgi:hypothetical protein